MWSYLLCEHRIGDPYCMHSSPRSVMAEADILSLSLPLSITATPDTLSQMNCTFLHS